ncbi:unnamed protein product, partial [Chrysoparadoxa australica]
MLYYAKQNEPPSSPLSPAGTVDRGKERQAELEQFAQTVEFPSPCIDRMTRFPVPAIGRQRDVYALDWSGSDGEGEDERDGDVSRQGTGSEQSQHPTLGAGTTRHWMPDSMCRACSDCEQPFNMFRRRHHCRVCGQVFCQACSSSFIDGRDFAIAGSVRVCHSCHDKHMQRLKKGGHQ